MTTSVPVYNHTPAATMETAEVPERDWLELSFAQRAVWLDSNLTNSPTAYTLLRAARITGDVDIELARQALTLVVARHDALRLRVDSSLPRQWMHTSTEAPFPLIDLSMEGDPSETLRIHIKKSLALGIELGDNWLFRFELVKLAEREFFLFMRCHHLLADEIGVSMILQHWLGAYAALNNDTAPELATPSSYLPVISSDTAYAESTRYKQDLDYWLGRFKSTSRPLLQPKSSAKLAGGLPDSAYWMFDGNLYRQFVAVATNAGLSPQRAVFGLFGAVLARRYAQSDITVGMALHRRDATNYHVVGMLAGMIAVRLNFDMMSSLTDIVRESSVQLDQDLRHQRLPIDVLSRELGISHAGLSEIFQVAFSFLPSERPAKDIAIEGVTFTPETLHSREASPITIHVRELAGESGMALDIAAHPDIVGAGEAERLLLLFREFVSIFAGKSDTEFGNIPAITYGERELVVHEWNSTAVQYPIDTADRLFHLQAKLTPEAVALVSASESLTYEQLDARSSQLANLLLQHGVTLQTVVAVALERSVATVVALIAILKAGAVYLPLDPSYPPDRLAHMLSDSGAALVITSYAISESLPISVERIILDTRMFYSDLPDSAPISNHSANHTAYIIYTSGSTGKPKGVAVPHSAAVNLAFGRLRHDPISIGDRVLAAISVGFDVSIGQLLLPLLQGAAVVIASDLRTLGAYEFWRFLSDHRVTHINSVPSFFESVLEAAPRSSTLVRLMLGGEPLSSALTRRLKQALPDTQVINMYGPTEACIDATCYPASQSEMSAVLPIGKPLPNYRAYILSDCLDPAGIGIEGDLYLAGAGIADGYINQPALTAESFIADPFGAPGQRLYRTGDRARWRSDGNIEFVGRADSQVKIRGHRIETGEIESALKLHPSVAQAAVVASKNKAGTACLVAYIVGHSGVPLPAGSQLRRHLANHLPEYMLPAAFCTIDALPLTSNGKLDIRALPEVDWQPSSHYIPPRTPTETAVASCFAEILEIPRVGADGNFFESGGHSLLATRLISQLRSHFNVNLPLRCVFERPTVEALASYVDHANLEHSPLFLTRIERTEQVPLSFTQERLWFLSKLKQDDSYNVPLAVRLRGPLDTGRAIKAVEQIVERHEALRTSIVLHDGSPTQRIQDSQSFQVERQEISDFPKVQPLLNSFARGRFDLSAELPIRLKLISLSSEDHVLAAVVHHSSFDGWSASLFFQEFALLYSGNLLPAANTQFADFALWERRQDLSEGIAYWKQALESAPPILEFPTDAAPKEIDTRPAGVVPITFNRDLHHSLLNLANANGASLFMVLHAAFACLLARWSGQTDIVIGTAVANRTRAEFESVIGCFVNTLALRTIVRPADSFLELITSTRDNDLAAFEHQTVPFEKVVDELQPERSAYHSPVFQVMLVLQSGLAKEIELPGLITDILPLDSGTAKFNLTLNLGAQPNGELAGHLEYASNLYHSSTIVRFADQFRRLLEFVASDPTRRPMEFDLLSSLERTQVLEDWNSTAANYPRATLDGLFHQQVIETPNQTAVMSETGSLTYRELDLRSNQLAHLLIRHGIERQSVVGVALERSIDTIVCLLAILKAGCTYLPLDVSYPADRLAHMLFDSAATVVIANSACSEILPNHLDRIFIDSPELFSSASISAPAALHTPDFAAYVIYTSGSTGKPKGVAVPHSAAVNLAFARLVHDPITTGDRILAAISVGFDVSIGQLILPLLNGATVVIARDLRSLTPGEFWQFLAASQVTHINSVPSFFESVLDAAPNSCSLTRLMLGGEPLTSTLVQRLQKALPNTEVINMYGPTEACIDATFYPATPSESRAVLPIGKPLANYRTYVLSDRLDPVGIGVVGELYLGGSGIAHAYINQAALTATQFVADPFDTKGGRLYKTGDRARWLADGNIEFLGRADNQVKIRGHRIELGEIEAQLRKHSGVREAAVILREDIPGDARLVAYYVADKPVPADSIRIALLETLPSYMAPAAYVHLLSLPLTANGKLDRKSLPAPATDAYPIRVFEPPTSRQEEQVAEVFGKTLKLPQVGRHDNFFELGGHSLLAITLIEQLRVKDIHVDVRHVFTFPTVAGLTVAASANSVDFEVPPNEIPTGAVMIKPEMLPLVKISQAEIDALAQSVPGGFSNIQDIYPLAPLQQGILFHHLMSETGDAYLTPFLLAFDRPARLKLFLDALRELINRHDILRTAVHWEHTGEPVQVVLRGAELPVEELDPCSVEQLKREYDPRTYRIDVRRAPMMRACVAKDSENDRWLLLLMSHHLILDHSSLELILREIQMISNGHRNLLPVPVPFRNFVAQAQMRAASEEHEVFFRKMLGDVTDPTTPYGLARVQGDGSGIREHSVVVSDSLATRLRQQSRTLGSGPATFFHLAWSLVLAHISDRRDVVFGTLLLGRTHGGGTQQTPGLFINTLPMRVKIDGSSVESGLRQIHQHLADLLVHEQASLALAQRCSGVAAPAPLFSSLLNFRHSPHTDDSSKWPGVELVFAQERTDYPVAIAIDDRTRDFLITAQADAPADPVQLCRLMETAVTNILDALEAAPETTLRDIHVLAAPDFQQVTCAWNQTDANYPSITLHAAFEAQAARNPDVIAVTYHSESLTYAELNAKAEQLADSLASQGVGLQTVVGVALPRSIDTVISLIAILKLGAIYLPLDPAYPQDRLDYIIADSDAKFVITNLDFIVGAETSRGVVTPQDIAYIIYTSGSTGKPKGVAVSHSAAVNLAYGRQNHDPISVGDRVLAAISIGFDVSIGQLLLPLLSGATIVIASDLRKLTAREFWDYLRTNRVTHINSVPSFFESILDAAPESSCLVRLMLGGEPLSSSLVRRLRKALPNTQIVNMYGPTEACIDATCYPISGNETAAVMPIGKPLPNYRCYILNDRLNPVGVGVAGDLYLAGAGLAHSYIKQPAFTAERFIADPFGADGGRLYKTGDRARWLVDGNIEFLGRADTQVKIRGHRIELGEIETALLLHPSVAQAAVIAEGGRLIAYLVESPNVTQANSQEIRIHLSKHIPEYMIPAAFHTLDALPLTPNGKLDIKALPKISSVSTFEAPKSSTELAMQQLWQQVLEMQPIGIHDDFFSLGGHSLAVMRLINLCNEHFQVTLPLRFVFDYPTIAKLSEAIDTNAKSNTHPSIVPLRASGNRTPLFCIHPAGGAVFRYAPLTSELSKDQPVYGLQARALLPDQPLAPSIIDTAKDYVDAVRSVQPKGPYQLLGWSSGGVVAYEMAQQLNRSGDTVSFLGLMDSSLPATMKKDPSEGELMHAFATTFGYEDLLEKPKLPKNSDELLERIRQNDRLPQGSEFSQFQRFFAVFCNTLRIYPNYHPPRWEGPFVLFRALKRSSPMPDWSGLTGGRATLIDMDCTHADLPSEAQAPILARHVENFLR